MTEPTSLLEYLKSNQWGDVNYIHFIYKQGCPDLNLEARPWVLEMRELDLNWRLREK